MFIVGGRFNIRACDEDTVSSKREGERGAYQSGVCSEEIPKEGLASILLFGYNF